MAKAGPRSLNTCGAARSGRVRRKSQIALETPFGKTILRDVGGGPMNPTLVRKNLIEVLVRIQTDSGLPCPPIVGGTQPAEELEKFDSKMWPVATGMLAEALG